MTESPPYPTLVVFPSECSSVPEDDYIEDLQERNFKEVDRIGERITRPVMTKYEKAKILGTRAAQISRNAPVFVKVGNLVDPLDIAELELREKKIPFVVRRFLPDGRFDDFKVSELRIDE
jgi:DNA-directed RNA polymerase I, II, and III subunit RPABC2